MQLTPKSPSSSPTFASCRRTTDTNLMRRDIQLGDRPGSFAIDETRRALPIPLFAPVRRHRTGLDSRS
jgi:hypothetical protein